jgi:hypothetical protein
VTEEISVGLRELNETGIRQERNKSEDKGIVMFSYLISHEMKKGGSSE